MCEFVRLEYAHLIESFATYITFVWPFSSVYALMSLEMGWEIKSFTTYTADMFL